MTALYSKQAEVVRCFNDDSMILNLDWRPDITNWDHKLYRLWTFNFCCTRYL